jgi:hypothetical protein
VVASEDDNVVPSSSTTNNTVAQMSVPTSLLATPSRGQHGRSQRIRRQTGFIGVPQTFSITTK